MRIELNGEPRELPDGASVGDAARAAGIEAAGRGVAVALDGEVVPRGELETTALRDGQSVEVVAAIGGGAVERGGAPTAPASSSVAGHGARA